MVSKSLKEVVLKPITGEWGTEGNNVQILRTTNFTNEGRVNYLKVVERNVDSNKIEKKKLKIGDIIIEKSGGSPKQPVGRVVFFEKEGVFLCNNFTAILRPKLDEVVPKYLLYILYCNHKFGFTSAYQNKTTGIINLQLPKYLEGTKIPLPPLEQQKKIAAILDAADTYRQKTKALITKYDALTQSLFLDMFGSLVGDKISLSTICYINPKKSEISSVDRSTLVSFMPMANVSVEGQVSHIEERTIDEVWSGFTYFKENDVVFAKITPCMENGKGAIMRNLKNSVGFGTTEFHVLRPLKAHSTAEYLFHLTHSEHFRALAEVNMTGSAGQKRVPRDFFDKFKLVAPALILQNQFAERVQAIEAQKAQAQASLAQAEDLFNSLLQRAFKGELV
jgi:type I restriction enzyme S subunit